MGKQDMRHENPKQYTVNNTNETTEQKLERLTREGVALEALMKEHQAAIDALRKEVRFARGTGDVTEAAAQAAQAAHAALAAAARPANEPTQSLDERVEAALRQGIWSLADLCAAVRAPANPVNAVLKRARGQRKVFNVGTEDRPRWTWIIGDDTETQAVYAQVARLIAERPFEFAELLAATGARRGRVSGAIVDLQKKGRRVINRGTANRAQWFLLDRGTAAKRKNRKRVA